MVRGERISKAYVIIAIFIILLIIITILFSGNQLIWAIIDDKYLFNGWKDSGDSVSYNRFFGLEKQGSLTYVIDENVDNLYPAFITITSIKTIFMKSEEDLLKTTIETINKAAEANNIIIDKNSSYSGNRVLNIGHKTNFVIFDGNKTNEIVTEEIRIIGETWNCGFSGSSVICIGVSQITDNKHNNPDYNYTHWIEIIGDTEGTFVNKFNSYNFINSNGLLFNVKCH